MNDYIDEVFGAQGYLAQRFPNYAPREGQIAFARATDEAIRDKTHLVCEAPTGTGKSLAYSVPAVYHAVRNDLKVLIVTANIALQEQLASKDLPLLKEVLPWKFSFALIKGRGNYLCHDRLYEEEAKGQLYLADHPEDTHLLHQLVDWARTTERGDVSELPFQPPSKLWRRFSTTSEDCKGKRCQFYDDCCSRKARQEAAEAEILVTNYHLLFQHLAVQEATGKSFVLPMYDIVIMDEAHKAGDIARDFFGFQLRGGAVKWASRLLSQIEEPSLHQDLIDTSEKFFRRLREFRDGGEYRVRLREPDLIPWEPLVKLLQQAYEKYREVAPFAQTTSEQANLERAAARCLFLASNVEEAMTLQDDNAVYFIGKDSRENAVLARKSIDVSQVLREQLFDDPSAESVILTSATFTSGGKFDYFVKELGIPEPRELVVESPFNYKEQALLIVPRGLPAPSEKEFSKAVADTFAEIVALAEGRTLGLFTSYRNLDRAYDTVLASGYPVLRQGHQPRTALVEEFRRDVQSVLLGTESFWAGVDVPGESCSCVVIDKFPFASPEDPILDAIRQKDDKWFFNYSLPRAIVAFAQGFGRLIRSTSDRGVVVVLDERIVTKSYGRLFLKSLPRVMKSRDLENVRDFLADDNDDPDEDTEAA